MKKLIKTLYMVATALIIGSIIFGLVTKNSFVENDTTNISKEYENSIVSLNDNDEFSKKYFNNNIENIDQLIGESDLIVKGQVTNDRILFNQSLKTKIVINQVIKQTSGNVKSGNEVYVFEPSYFLYDTYVVEAGYNIMKENEEYILFLKHLDVPKDYEYKNNEAITFLPTSTYFGKYNLDKKGNTKVLTNINQISYEKVQNFGVISGNENLVSKFESFKQEIENEFY
ncbi:hypothetical protein [Anaerobacillus sp. 1_MG-2023]|uniref:hypothetical protein n=1 Tax=Bacillales TaxID=1385 RepID=UPI0026E3E54A|nr:hypothetical protein [Anaerobacillus sp. 1_MG-2023]MDO6657181.1 hypothetical protein [Anaerobacillus sp. 1_MG-2023]